MSVDARHFGANLVSRNLVRARAAKAKKRRLYLVEEWQREELQLTPFAILDEPPPELFR
jgi:hypothetical protein